jgi:hypothetical protein
MAIPRKALQVKIPDEAHAAFERLCKFTERSQAKLIEIIIRRWEKGWLDRMTEEEKARYLTGEMGLDESSTIRLRAVATVGAD